MYKKVLSYIWPLTKKIPSTINGTLELTWMNGQKVLNSKHANYSYGTLQRLLTYGLSKVHIQPTAEVLLLGLGGGSVLQSLRTVYKHIGPITAIEIDETVIQIAREEFDITNTNTLTILCDDAFDYVHNCTNTYKLIIVDIFIDHIVPERFYTPQFWTQLATLLPPRGTVIFNAGIDLTEHTKIDRIKFLLKDTFSFSQYNNVEQANTLLIGQRK